MRRIATWIGLVAVPAGMAVNWDWQAVELAPFSVGDASAMTWRAYRGSELTVAAGARPGQDVLQVAVKQQFGGLRVEATPRGGMGNRVRMSLTYRVPSGAPVTLYVGPNSWSQTVGHLTSSDWETVTFETGLLYDLECVLHLSQGEPLGVFEIAELTVEAAAGRGRRALVSVDARSPAAAMLAYQQEGAPPPQLTRQPVEGGSDMFRVAVPEHRSAQSILTQGLGALPAGTLLTFTCRCKTEGDVSAAFGFRDMKKAELGRRDVLSADWHEVVLEHRLAADDRPSWFMGGVERRACTFTVESLQVWAELPDPLGQATATLPLERSPIRVAATSHRKFAIEPPWPGIRAAVLDLEATSRWGFKRAAAHDSVTSEAGDEATITWRYDDDPVAYTARLTVSGADSVLVETRLTNGGTKPAPAMRPMLCWQIPGLHSPRTFAYTMIPRRTDPFPWDRGTYFVSRPSLWQIVARVKVHYTGTQEYRDVQNALAAGEPYTPPTNTWIREAGDFPLLARRLPGRDAWIAWVVSDTPYFFGNAATPCMHMDPIIPECKPGATASAFGKLLFFEGTWDELYQRAVAERRQLLPD